MLQLIFKSKLLVILLPAFILVAQLGALEDIIPRSLDAELVSVAILDCVIGWATQHANH